MAVDSKTMRVTGKDVKDFMNSFDSPKEVIEELESKTKELARDIDALVHSMGNLFEQNALVYGMADVCIKVEMTALGTDIIKAQIGTPGLLKHISENIAKEEAKEKVEE